MRRNVIVNSALALGLFGVLLMSACSSQPARVGDAGETKDSYFARASDQLDKMQTEIDQVRAHTATLPTDQAAEGARSITDLEAAMTTARSQLDELKSSDEENWQSFRPRVEATLSEMRQTLDRTMAAE